MKKSPGTCPTGYVSHRPGQQNRFAFFLRALGLHGKTAHDKFIPATYLTARPEDRLALLQGLLDTDGSAGNRGNFEFCSASQRLAQEVQQLVWSLGGRARLAKKPNVKAWRLWGRLPAGVSPFRLTRKAQAISADPASRAIARYIRSVEPVGFAQCVCIAVEHPERLYVTRDYVVTHNTLGFALLYGMSAKGLADRLGIPLDEAEELFASYFNVFNRIKTWVDKQVAFGQSHGYVVSKFGRRLPIWEYRSDKRWIQQKGDRACVNYPIQGSATGDYMKIAMVRAVRTLKKAGLADRVRLVMNVHDALEFYVHRSLNPEDVIAVLQPAVIFPVAGWPTMKADWHIGRRWGSPVEVAVEADGTIRIGDAPPAEVKPGIEFDEDGDEIEIMPDLDAADIRDVMHLPNLDQLGNQLGTHLGGAGRRLLIEVDTLPTEDAFTGFLNLITSTPGTNVVVLRTPDGDIDFGEGNDRYAATGLSTVHTAQISLFLGPARLSWDENDLADLTENLTL